MAALRLPLLFFVLAQILYGTSAFNGCVKKVRYSHAITSSSLQLPLSQERLLIYSTKKLQHFEKHDPFLSLYLVKNPKPYAYPFKILNKKSTSMAAVTSQHYFKTHISRHQFGLEKLALINTVVAAPSLLLSSCCSVLGLITPFGIIEKPYIEHFLDSGADYGDIGIRFDSKKNSPLVAQVDPFFRKNPFKVGDKIYAIDGKAVTSAREAMQKILFSKKGKKIEVAVLRQKRRYKITLFPKLRVGGGALSDTFLERKGLFFDDDLHLKTIKTDDLLLQGLKVSDRLLQVNTVPVYSFRDIRQALSGHDEETLLFRRDGFDFFIKLQSNLHPNSRLKGW